MTTKKKSLLVLCTATVLVGGVAFANFNSISKFFTSGKINVDEYSLKLNGTTNVLTGITESVVKLFNGNSRTISHEGYTHTTAEAWGTLNQDGYFKNQSGEDGRIGGLLSISYEIDKDLTVEYGYDKWSKPEYYKLTLDSDNNSVSFPEEQGHPDRFKVVNEGEEPVTITSMQFNYSCSQHDEHVHVGHNHKVGEKYYRYCEICEQDYEEIDYTNSKIKIGTNAGDTAVYNPYNLSEYKGVGTLDFDCADNDGTFVLNLSGDHSNENIYIDTNNDSYPAQRIMIHTSNDAKIHNITAKGGYGVLLFDGEGLEVKEGIVDSETYYTNVRCNLTFVGGATTATASAIKMSNGQLVLENNSNIDVNNYEKGIALMAKITNGGLNQVSGNIKIRNTKIGIYSECSDTSVRLAGDSDIVIDNGFEAVSTQNLDLFVEDGTHNWTVNVDGMRAIKPQNVTVGSATTSPTVTVKTSGGSAIEDSKSTAQTYNFISGTITFEDQKNSTSEDVKGIANIGKNIVNVGKDATLTVQNFGIGIHTTGDVTLIKVLGKLDIRNCIGGINQCSVEVGNDTTEGALKVFIDASKDSGKAKYGLFQNTWQSFKLLKGRTVFYSNSNEENLNTKAIVLEHSYDPNKFITAEGTKLGFGLLKYGFDLELGGVYSGNFEGLKGTTYSYLLEGSNRATRDLAWYSVNKPAVVDLANKAEFDNMFSI